MSRFTATLVLALLVAPALLPAAAAEGMSQTEFEQTLAEMQADVRLASERYAAGDVSAALEAAQRVAGQFATDETGSSELETKIKEASAAAIGDKVKALATKLATAIQRGDPVDAVEEIVAELEPRLNNLVLVAEGRVTPASQRELRSPEEIDAAVEEVRASVREVLAMHASGDSEEASFLANETFILFELNGIGGDTEVVDKSLEDAAENLIVQTNVALKETRPGLGDLIDQGASREAIEAKAEEVFGALEEIRELLKATLPPLNLGDANGDGRVNIVDALLSAQAALGLVPKTGEMDVNGDGAVTIVDALFIAQAALGIRRL